MKAQKGACVRMKVEDVQVSDPDKAMRRFQFVLGKVVKAPKTETKAKHKQTTGRSKRTRKKR
jgi:hypothetical protein